MIDYSVFSTQTPKKSSSPEKIIQRSWAAGGHDRAEFQITTPEFIAIILDAKKHGTYYRKPKQRLIQIGNKNRPVHLSVKNWILDLHQLTAKTYDRNLWWQRSRALDPNELVQLYPCYYPFEIIRAALAEQLSEPIVIPFQREYK